MKTTILLMSILASSLSHAIVYSSNEDLGGNFPKVNDTCDLLINPISIKEISPEQTAALQQKGFTIVSSNTDIKSAANLLVLHRTLFGSSESISGFFSKKRSQADVNIFIVKDGKQISQFYMEGLLRSEEKTDEKALSASIDKLITHKDVCRTRN